MSRRNAAEGDEPPQREIFVPFDDLHVILSSDVQRVFVTREEYEALAAKAKLAARPEEHAQPAAVLSADYVATIEENRARLMGTLVVMAPNDASKRRGTRPVGRGPALGHAGRQTGGARPQSGRRDGVVRKRRGTA